MTDRREFLKRSAAAVAGAAFTGCRPERDRPLWANAAFRRRSSSAVTVLPADRYDRPLADVVRRGIEACGLSVGGRRIVLKPNFVEFDPEGVINTHPSVVAGTVEAFRSLGAAEVVVAEGPGHRRDNQYLLEASGLDLALRDTRTRYVDLNTDAVAPVPLRSRYTSLDRLYLPRTVLRADLLVSMPKLKTHHWAGVTLSLKNLFGIVPGSIYGWPKNLLHYQGIEASILDINAALSIPRFNIVDGIVGMEGNGPIQGDARRSGVLIFGEDPVAVDATGARLMAVEPERVLYLREAGRFLGNLDIDRIEQRGESLARFRKEYRLLEQFEDLRSETPA